jgi:GT2 family glycosyltransferase
MLLDRLTSLVNPLPQIRGNDIRIIAGTSLAVRSEVFSAVGGMPASPFREDIAFVANARRAGYRLRHPLDVQVAAGG